MAINLNTMEVESSVQDLSNWHNANQVILVDESDLERTYPTTTATVNTSNGNVDLSTNGGDTYDIEVGDIFQCHSDDNQYSAVVSTAPTWTGGAVWRMVVDTNGSTNEAVASASWNCRASWTTASAGQQANNSFLCDTDGEFSDDEDGKVVVV